MLSPQKDLSSIKVDVGRVCSRRVVVCRNFVDIMMLTFRYVGAKISKASPSYIGEC